MNPFESPAGIRSQKKLLLAGIGLLTLAFVIWACIAGDRRIPGSASQAEGRAVPDGHAPKTGSRSFGKKPGGSGGVDQERARNSQQSLQASAGTSRKPLQFRAKPVEPAAVIAVVAGGGKTVDERVSQLRRMRGISFSPEEREAALEFLSGQQLPENTPKSMQHWLADELLTVMRLQEPQDEDLAVELGNAAFQPETDPVVRDYIMQHLGHLWEQSGSREEIEKSLWRAVDTADETTPGTALIALSRGYERDGQEKELAKVRQQALTLARNPDSPLAVRVTALSIAGDGGEKEVKRLAGELVGNPETPVILKRVAERVLK